MRPPSPCTPGSSSPARYNDDDTIGGIFFGAPDPTREEANLRRLEHALRPEHESCASSSGENTSVQNEEPTFPESAPVELADTSGTSVQPIRVIGRLRTLILMIPTRRCN